MFNTCEIGVSQSCCWWVSSSWMLFCIGWSIATSVSKNRCALEMLITIYQSIWHNIPGESWCLMLATNPFRMLYFQFQIKGLKYMKHNFTCCFVCMQNFAYLWIYSAQEHIWIQERGCESYKTSGICTTVLIRLEWLNQREWDGQNMKYIGGQANNFWEGKSRTGAMWKICK